MRRAFLFAGVAALVLASCSPQTFTMNVEMRYPSKSGIDLSRKSMSIVYMDDGQADSTFSNRVASALARNLEEDYFNGNEVIGVYKVPSDSVTLDLMHGLVMDSGDDVIFLLGRPTFGEPSVSNNAAVQHSRSVDSAFVANVQIPYNVRLYVYDSMDKSDRVRDFRGNSILRVPVYNNGVMAQDYIAAQGVKDKVEGAELIGAQIFNRFAPVWKAEGYSLYYYDDFEGDWIDAINYVYNYEWKKAADIWMGKMNVRNEEKKACACYNTAVAFYMLGDLNLATKWLDRADTLYDLALSPGLRKRIEARK